MQCNDARELLATGERSDELSEHLESCEECQTFAAKLSTLASLLDEDAPQEPRPGFDTRFFARLEEHKQKETTGLWQRLRWVVAGGSVAVAAATAAVLVMIQPPSIDPVDLELAMHLEMLEEMEMLENLEEVEAFELLAELDDEDLIGEQP